MKLNEAELCVGRSVCYKPWPDAPPGEWEYGVICSVVGGVVFVIYNDQHPTAHAKATRPEDLEMIDG